MYQEVGIQKLSTPQIRKLLKGDRVIVRKGEDHKLMVNPEQHANIMKAHLKGKGLTIRLDPYAIDMNQKEGSGLLSSLKKLASPVIRAVAPVVAPIAKTVAPVLLDVGKQMATDLISKQLLGKGAVKKQPKRRGRPRKGDGFFTENVVPLVGRTKAFQGRGKKQTKKEGEGLLGDIIAPIARKVILGRGKKQVKEGSALLPAGYGEGFLDFLL